MLKTELKSADNILAVKKLKDELSKLKNSLKQSGGVKLDFKDINGTKLCVCEVENGDIKAMIDDFKNKFEKAVILIAQKQDEKVCFACGVKNAPLKAGALVKEIAQALGGNGGGRDDFATAGAKNSSKLNEALKEIYESIEKSLK